MFTGIIEATGVVQEISTSGSNRSFWISSSISGELKVDQSVSHDGVCLTVEELRDKMHRVTAIDETIKKTNLATWKEGFQVNLERCLTLNGRLDGHFVQGHVDTTATCISKEEKDGSWEYRFRFDPKHSNLIIEKGSISMNGISLTIFDTKRDEFSIAVIPYTYTHTNVKAIDIGSLVNIEFDMIGKYIDRMVSSKVAMSNRGL
jgi:riboflavin synthase